MAIFAFLFTEYLYFVHIFLHKKTNNKVQTYLRKCHAPHHIKRGFYMHPVEWVINVIIPFFWGMMIVGKVTIVVLLAWGLFEAYRGHGDLLGFKWLPKKFYKYTLLVGMPYHMYHHRYPENGKNMSQFLWVSDWLHGTMAKKWTRRNKCKM